VKHEPTITLTAEPSRDDVQFLDDRLYEFNVERTGLADGRLFGVFARDEGGRIVAGLFGWTWGACCEIRFLWVDARWRGQGLGRRLLELAENEARARAVEQIVLSTHSFQAPRFYQQLGFEIVGSISDYPAGHQQIHLRKRLIRPSSS
jgi:GNAT superfamily N-acetyltransferase